jgi:hypothetical protein
MVLQTLMRTLILLLAAGTTCLGIYLVHPFAGSTVNTVSGIAGVIYGVYIVYASLFAREVTLAAARVSFGADAALRYVIFALGASLIAVALYAID